jgi:hypothetical protein
VSEGSYVSFFVSFSSNKLCVISSAFHSCHLGRVALDVHSPICCVLVFMIQKMSMDESRTLCGGNNDADTVTLGYKVLSAPKVSTIEFVGNRSGNGINKCKH